MNGVPAVLVEPSAATIVERARAFTAARPPGHPSTQTRDTLGLPVDGPIVMTGHQASWWHPGILAKFFACAAIADCAAMHAAWIVPDQDEQAFDTIEAPVRRSGSLARESVRLIPTPPASAPVASLPAFDIAAPRLVGEPACDSIEPGLCRFADAVSRHREASNAARQIAGALADLMSPRVRRAPTVFATAFHKTTYFRELVARLGADADRATAIYNKAVSSEPHAHVAPLRRDDRQGRYELPLWRIPPNGPRRAVWSDEIADVPHAELAPKALLMTGFLRAACADLFIHGTGGGIYDRITETWLRNWLGIELAPVLVVSATLTLPIGAETPDAATVAHSRWRAHHARHHPRELGRDDLQQRRDALVETIRRARDAAGDPADEFRALHDLLDEYRRDERDRLAALRREAATLAGRLGEREIAQDRTWPFFLHQDESLDALDRAVRDAVCDRPAAVGA